MPASHTATHLELGKGPDSVRYLDGGSIRKNQTLPSPKGETLEGLAIHPP